MNSTTDISRAAYRRHLNEQFSEPTYRNGRYRQRSRPYGDYLWHQDRAMFEVSYQEWLARKEIGQ